MPEIFKDYQAGGEQPDLAEQFEALLDAQTQMTLRDLDNIEIIIHARLRSLLTPEQLHHRAHRLIAMAEHMLHLPGAFRDPDTGEEVLPILVENFEGGVEEVLAMTQAQSVDDDDIALFLSQFANEGEEE